MKVIPFNFGKHLAYAEQMLISRQMDPNLIKDLPMHGLIAFEDDQPIAMGFLRCAEGEYAIMDSYLSNASTPSELRNKALDRITAKLVKIAKNNGIRKLLAFSADTNTVIRSIKHGFGYLPNIFTLLNLS